MYMSVEHELPVTDLFGMPVLPEIFSRLWDDMEREGWNRSGFLVSRKAPQSRAVEYLAVPQVITTDTGPTIEIAPSPCLTVEGVDHQVRDLRSLIQRWLQPLGKTLIGSGIHPRLGWSVEEYYRYRTPRKPYDYAIRERNWTHRSILHIAASQEIVDVPFDQAITVLRLLHRLSGLFLFLFRNDPDYHGTHEGRLSVRPFGWKSHIPKSGPFACDRCKVGVPDSEILSWEDYVTLLWDKTPMFMLGTKNSGLVYLPAHPTFREFLVDAPRDGWDARTVDTGENIHLIPEASHVIQTDWTYMGFARLRWKWHSDSFDIQDLIRAREQGSVESFLREHLCTVMVEHRSNATSPPGSECASLACIVGLLENLDRSWSFASQYPYDFWRAVTDAAEWQKIQSNVGGMSIPVLLTRMLEIAGEGLVSRGNGEEHYLLPLHRRIEEGSVSESMLALFERGGMDAVLEELRYS